MAVLQMLTEVVGSEEFLTLIALAKFVNSIQMLNTSLPLWRTGKLVTTVTTSVRRWRRRKVGVVGCRTRSVDCRGGSRVKGSLKGGQRCA